MLKLENDKFLQSNDEKVKVSFLQVKVLLQLKMLVLKKMVL